MTHSVVDTNVLVVANGSSTASVECRIKAVQELRGVMAKDSLILDSGDEILGEYRRHCSYSGQPGVGDEFFRLAHERQGWLRRVQITPDTNRYFKEFPADPHLASFDPADRKFVAASLAAASGVPATSNTILNAVDSDYAHFQHALRRAGVKVTELCPAELKQQPAS